MRYLSGLLILFCPLLSAQSLWLATEPETMRANIVTSWSECEPQRWCEDGVGYYQAHLYAEATLTPERLVVTLFGEFTPHLLSQLQLNLRRDGFQLVKISIEQQEFDLEAALQTMPANEVDKTLVTFINQSPQSAERVLSWQASVGQAELRSDGELITVRFDYSQ